jgi:Uracil DNA glycosylase superfamily
MPKSLAEFYAPVCGCAQKCTGIKNCKTDGWVPRGFYTEYNPKNPILLMAVCRNPGHPLSIEMVSYQNSSCSTETAERHLAFSRDVFYGLGNSAEDARRKTVFHRNLIRYLKFFLDVPECDVFKVAAYTNLVKCSTLGLQDRLHTETVSQCFDQHFRREVDYFNPRVLLAFGREVENYLKKAKKENHHNLPIVYIKHPSYFYQRDMEERELCDIKDRIKEHLKNVITPPSSPHR